MDKFTAKQELDDFTTNLVRYPPERMLRKYNLLIGKQSFLDEKNEQRSRRLEAAFKSLREPA